MNYKSEFITLAVLNILDVLSTIYFLEFNIFSEGNPIALYLMSNMGYVGLVLPKIIFLGLIAWCLLQKDTKNSKFAKYGLWTAILLYTIVVVINIGGIILFYL